MLVGPNGTLPMELAGLRPVRSAEAQTYAGQMLTGAEEPLRELGSLGKELLTWAEGEEVLEEVKEVNHDPEPRRCGLRLWQVRVPKMREGDRAREPRHTMLRGQVPRLREHDER